MESPVLEGLRSSRKGTLKYDTNWYNDGRIHNIVEECTSPPSFPPELVGVVNVLNRLSSSSPGEDQVDTRGSFHGSPKSPLISSPHSSKLSAVRSARSEDDHNQDSVEIKEVDAETQAYYKRTGEVEVSILHCEKAWDDIAKERVKERQREYEEHSKMLTDQAVQNTTLLAQQLELKNRTIFKKIREVHEESEQTRQRRLRHQQERQRLHAKRMDAKLRAAQQEKEKAEEAERLRRVREMEAYLKAMMNVKQNIDEVAKRIVAMLDGCRHKAHLPETATLIRKKVEALCRQAYQQVKEATDQGASMQLVEGLNLLIVQMMQCQELAAKAVGESDRLAQEEATRKAKEAELAAKQKAAEQKTQSVVTSSAGGSAPVSAAGAATSKAQGSASLNKFVTEDALKEYEAVQQKLAETIQAYQTLKGSTDPQVKKFRNDIMKAVNTPINAISVQSGRQLLDQLRRLNKLLAGESVEIAGGRRVSIAALPSGKAYCQETLARKLVAQCDKQISSNHETAFPFAAITVALWRDYPDVKQLMLAHFYKGCPFLLPYYIPKQDKQSTEDYYKALGYVFDDDGNVEAQDKYLKRLSGFMRLYAALIATKPLGGNSVHPHGPSEGWRWLSRIMNLEPQPDVTATMLLDFLEVCGHTLANSYGKQFFKLLQALCRQFFTKIESVTPKGAASGGPMLRLKNFLETCIKTQKISPPKGLLTDAFWRS